MINGAANALGLLSVILFRRTISEHCGFTNLNAQSKRAADREKHKGDWTDISLEELKAYHGILFMMDVMQFERDELYWYSSHKYWVPSSKIGEIMARDRFVQIKRYLHFSDDSDVNPP